LCLLVGASVLIIQLIVSTVFYYILKNDFYADANKFIINEVKVLNSLLKRHAGDLTALDQEVIWEPQSDNNKFMVRIYSQQGKILKESQDFQQYFPRKPPRELIKKLNLLQSVNLNKKYFALMNLQLNAYDKKNSQYLMQIVYNMTHEQHMLKRLATNLTIITVLEFMLTFFIIVFFIKYGLRPLQRVKEEIINIDINQLNQRLSEENLSIELRPIVNAFNRLLERIQKNIEQLKSFSANLAHELRTPINNLMMSTEVSLNKSLSVEEAKEILTSSMEEYTRIASIIERLLFLARFDAKQGRISKELLNCRAEIELVVDFHQALAEKKNIKINIEGSGNIYVDKTLFRNALTNVLTNAVKYCDAESLIKIFIQREQEGTLITIEDNGLGVPITAMSQLTEKFYRVDDHRSSTTGGSGLGLAIVESIINAHQGRLTFKEAQPQGLIVELFFPN